MVTRGVADTFLSCASLIGWGGGTQNFAKIRYALWPSECCRAPRAAPGAAIRRNIGPSLGQERVPSHRGE